jgi:hypothetical protein
MPRDNLVGLIRADVGSAGESKASLALPLHRQLTRDIGRIDPSCLENLSLSLRTKLQTHDQPIPTVLGRDTQLAYTGRVSYPSAPISPVAKGRPESEKPARKYLQNIKGKDPDPLHVMEMWE